MATYSVRTRWGSSRGDVSPVLKRATSIDQAMKWSRAEIREGIGPDIKAFEISRGRRVVASCRISHRRIVCRRKK